jgi:hypothetical protein
MGLLLRTIFLPDAPIDKNRTSSRPRFAISAFAVAKGAPFLIISAADAALYDFPKAKQYIASTTLVFPEAFFPIIMFAAFPNGKDLCR